MAGNVEERGTPRREIAWRGGIVRAEAGQRPRLIGTIGNAAALMKTIDDDATYFRPAGRIGLQIEMYGLGRVDFKEIRLQELER